ncbi:MAG: MoaD/ThiS family protein [Candidatus Helarchaeota archaeon]
MAKIQLIGPLENEVGVSEIFYDGETIREAINKFIDDYKDKLKKFLDQKTGFLSRYLMILVNTKNVIFLKDKLDTRLSQDDHIIIALPIGGG